MSTTYKTKSLARVVGNKIKEARKSLGLSQKELGGKLKISDKAISAYEVGRSLPGFDTLHQIGQITHKPIGYFETESESKDIDLQIKIKTIEKELLEIKKILQTKRN